ncbi:hypothetical protein GH714_018121 [Hevea brasiliensis]|uniref:Late embryogenesis abundant protein LEA-2 subgroup domain-containing protein n=1 Tax=Hevea brasiliensis TaxID=3981 RepID=A0A6A6LHL9_HEVBR|nr:hypothetical protein GH714_018121 [Hevea brasiliensis]
MKTFHGSSNTKFRFFLLPRPQEPRFSLSTIRVNSFRLSVYSSSTLFISSVVSLTLNAQNHNKVGIKYIPSKLNIYYHGIPIGLIRVPGFYQPAHSDNIKVTTQISLHCVNVSQIISESLLQDKARKKVVQVKAIGDIRVRLFLFRLASPKIKIALDCDIDLDYAELPFKNYELFNNMDVVQHHLPGIHQFTDGVNFASGGASALVETSQGNEGRDIYKIGGRKFAFVGMGAFDCAPKMRALKQHRGHRDKEATSLENYTIKYFLKYSKS